MTSDILGLNKFPKIIIFKNKGKRLEVEFTPLYQWSVDNMHSADNTEQQCMSRSFTRWLILIVSQIPWRGSIQSACVCDAAGLDFDFDLTHTSHWHLHTAAHPLPPPPWPLDKPQPKARSGRIFVDRKATSPLIALILISFKSILYFPPSTLHLCNPPVCPSSPVPRVAGSLPARLGPDCPGSWGVNGH